MDMFFINVRYQFPVGNEEGSTLGAAMVADVEGVTPKKQNAPNFDFFNYAGIIRPVKIYTTPKRYIKDVKIVPIVDGKSANINYVVDTVGDGEVTIIIYDENQKEVGRASGENGNIVIEEVILWKPLDAYLYTAKIKFEDDSYEVPFGVRTVEVRGTQFLINGEPFYFKGFGKHEDSNYHGRGLDEVLNVKDLALMKWMGANSFRTSHYPYSEEMMRLCDREGIVVMWSIANESDTTTFPDSSYEYYKPLYYLAHECDPQNRPVTIVGLQNDFKKDKTLPMTDVICLNRYYGWYIYGGDLDAAKQALTVEFDYWKTIGKPLMFTEYGADTVSGLHLTTPTMFTEEYQVEFLKANHEVFDKTDFFIGEQVWNFADFATIQGVMRADGNKKGIFTRDRRPKFGAHYLRNRWLSIPDFGYKSK